MLVYRSLSHLRVLGNRVLVSLGLVATESGDKILYLALQSRGQIKELWVSLAKVLTTERAYQKQQFLLLVFF